MATFLELLADTYTITKRPNLVEETKLAIKVATLKAHQKDFFPKDLYETGVSFLTSSYTQQLDYKTILPRWRAIKYLRKYNALGVPPIAGAFLKLKLPEQVLDSYGVSEENIFYLAGSSFQIRSSTKEKYYLLGCYLNPDITEATFSSWIALDHPYLIVFEAARVLFKSIGFDEQSVEMTRLVAEQYAILQQEITGEGF